MLSHPESPQDAMLGGGLAAEADCERGGGGGHIVSVLRSLRARCWDGCNGMASRMQHPWFTDMAGCIFSLILLWQFKLTDILFCVTKLYSVIITKQNK